MPYPTGILSLTLEDIDRQIAEIKRNCTDVKNEAAAGNMPSARILDLYLSLQDKKASLTAAAATPGIAAYAQAQKNNATLDIAAAFSSVLSALDGVLGWIVSNFPKDASGFLLAKTFSGNTIVDRTFTPTQTAGFRTA